MGVYIVDSVGLVGLEFSLLHKAKGWQFLAVLGEEVVGCSFKLRECAAYVPSVQGNTMQPLWYIELDGDSPTFMHLTWHMSSG